MNETTRCMIIQDNYKILTHFGFDLQIKKTVEELQELKEAILTECREDIVDELADVHNMLEQIKLIFEVSEDELVTTINKKLTRTNARIDSGYYTKKENN